MACFWSILTSRSSAVDALRKQNHSIHTRAYKLTHTNDDDADNDNNNI